MTITPSRALEHQRNYRARKAQYVADLEERCRVAEEEAARLREELSEARADLAAARSGVALRKADEEMVRSYSYQGPGKVA